MRRLIRTAYLGLDLGDTTSLEEPGTVEAIRAAGVARAVGIQAGRFYYQVSIIIVRYRACVFLFAFPSLSTALALTAVALAVPTAQAQVCEGNFTLNTQAEVDAFACTEVTGTLTYRST